MNLDGLIQTLLSLFLIMAVGFVAGRAGIFPAHFQRDLSTLVLKVALPCMVLAAALQAAEKPDVGMARDLVVLSVVGYGVLYVCGWALHRALFAPAHVKRLYLYATLFSNMGYIGYPVVAALFGQHMVIYTAISAMFYNVMTFTHGKSLMSGGTARESVWRALISPGLICSLLAIVLFFGSIRVPAFVTSALASVGNMTTPASMLVIGLSMATADLKKIFGIPRVYGYAALKMLAVPVVCWLVFRMICANEQAVALMTLICAMPVASSTVMFANEYEYEIEKATAVVFFTTVLCIVTIPVVVNLLFL